VNKLPAILLLPVLLATAGAQEISKPAPLISEPICGLCAASHTYLDETGVRSGLVVDMLVGPGEVNQPVTFRFFVCQRPSNWPEDRLEIEHEKYIHVIGVRNDLRDFFHIHPVKTGPGMWAVDYTFTNAGIYKIWTDVRWKGVSYTFSHPALRINGEPGPGGEARNFDFRDSVTASGYRVTLKHSKPLVSGQTNQLEFIIRDASGNRVAVENFLGAPMHLVMVKEDLSAYVHAHPDLASIDNSYIHFSSLFVADGVYKLFAQFRPVKAKLPPDDAILAEFYVKVERGYFRPQG
jgi:hypothetical protein